MTAIISFFCWHHFNDFLQNPILEYSVILSIDFNFLKIPSSLFVATSKLSGTCLDSIIQGRLTQYLLDFYLLLRKSAVGFLHLFPLEIYEELIFGCQLVPSQISHKLIKLLSAMEVHTISDALLGSYFFSSPIKVHPNAVSSAIRPHLKLSFLPVNNKAKLSAPTKILISGDPSLTLLINIFFSLRSSIALCLITLGNNPQIFSWSNKVNVVWTDLSRLSILTGYS